MLQLAAVATLHSDTISRDQTSKVWLTSTVALASPDFEVPQLSARTGKRLPIVLPRILWQPPLRSRYNSQFCCQGLGSRKGGEYKPANSVICTLCEVSHSCSVVWPSCAMRIRRLYQVIAQMQSSHRTVAAIWDNRIVLPTIMTQTPLSLIMCVTLALQGITMQTWAKWSARRVDLAIFSLCISRCVSTIATLVLQICFSVAAEKRFS